VRLGILVFCNSRSGAWIFADIGKKLAKITRNFCRHRQKNIAQDPRWKDPRFNMLRHLDHYQLVAKIGNGEIPIYGRNISTGNISVTFG